MKGKPNSPAPTPSKPEKTQKKVHQKVMPKSNVESIHAAISALGPDPDSTVLISLREALQKAKDLSGKPENPRQEARKSSNEGVEEAKTSVARLRQPSNCCMSIVQMQNESKSPWKGRQDNVVFSLLEHVSILTGKSSNVPKDAF